jgi:Kef-type K+ transport system membrane component KefB
MTPFLQLALALAVIISAAKAGGYLSYRLGQPSVLGELLVGVALGPSVIDLLHIGPFTDAHLAEVVHQLAELGVLLLMFVAGLDLHLEDLARTGKVAALAGVLGVLLPLALGVGVGVLFGAGWLPAIFIGLILSATSVSISAQTLMELKVLRSRVGIGLLGAAVFDDILVVLGLSVFLALTDPNAGGGIIGALWSAARMLIYLLLALASGRWLLPRLARRVAPLPISQGLIAFAFVCILLYAWAAEAIGGMAAITGAFVAGLMLARSPQRERIENGISAIAYGVFVPVFFVNVGLSANARELTGENLLLLAALTVAAVVGKVAGAGYGALLSGFSRREALQLGVGMMSRGEVGLIVASVGIAQGAIDRGVFSAVVGLVIITTLLTPPLLRSLFTSAPEAARTNAEIDPGTHIDAQATDER